MNIIYLDQYHYFNETIMPKAPVVVKVGVDGIYDLERLVALYPQARVYAYEADPGNFSRWEARARCFGVVMENRGLGPEGGNITLHRFTNTVSHSEFPRHTYDRNCKLVDTVEVPTVSLRQMVTERGHGQLSLLILNCEGGELHAMRELYDKNLRDRIDQICISFHDPRIYKSEHKAKFLTDMAPHYHVVRDNRCPRGGIPDYLLIRRV